jgi:uncharacterized protein YndB with AHSA1/START domain
MSKSTFVYVTYIAATPEKVFQALTEPPLTRQYWGLENVSDWKPGSPWRHQSGNDAKTVRMLGEVVECSPPRRLVITWAFPSDAANRSKHTRVAFDIERIGAELPGISVFAKDEGDAVFHTYSCYSRGVDMLNGAYHYLDLTPKGRDESGQARQAWLRRHDEYPD